MPRISFRDYTAGSRPWWDYLTDAGEAVAKGVQQQHKDTLEAAENKTKAETDRQRLAIEEARAKTSLLAESNRASAAKERQAAQDADRQAAVQGLQELAGQKQQDAVRKGIEAAVASPGGALGPFGLFTATAQGAAGGLAKAQANMGPKIAIAERMSPAGARMFLQRETQAQKQATIAEAYQKEADAVMAGVQDGVLTPEIAKGMVEALQSGLRSGALPGQIHKQVAKAYDLHAKVQKRLAGWQESDRKAGEAVAMIEKMATQAVDPKVRDALLDKVAKAKGEWGRTMPQSFREKHDGEASLAALEQVVFGAQADTGELPTQPEYSPPPPPIPTREQVIAGVAKANSRGGEPGARKETAGPLTARPGPPPEKGATPPTAVEPSDKVKFGKTVEDFVAANGRAAVSQGTDQREEVKKILASLAKETGLEPGDPFLKGAVMSALLKLQGGQLAFNEPPKPEPKSYGRAVMMGGPSEEMKAMALGKRRETTTAKAPR